MSSHLPRFHRLSGNGFQRCSSISCRAPDALGFKLLKRTEINTSSPQNTLFRPSKWTGLRHWCKYSNFRNTNSVLNKFQVVKRDFCMCDSSKTINSDCIIIIVFPLPAQGSPEETLRKIICWYCHNRSYEFSRTPENYQMPMPTSLKPTKVRQRGLLYQVLTTLQAWLQRECYKLESKCVAKTARGL
jgi:hypothetical protein